MGPTEEHRDRRTHPETGHLLHRPNDIVPTSADDGVTNIADYGGDRDQNNIGAAYTYNPQKRTTAYSSSTGTNAAPVSTGPTASKSATPTHQPAPSSTAKAMTSRMAAEPHSSIPTRAITDNPRHHGPGCAGIYTDNDTESVTYRFYGPDNAGHPRWP